GGSYRPGGCRQQAGLSLLESDRHQGMTKKKVLEGLRRVIEGNTGKTSEVVREFKQCPQFQQCCFILSQALQHNTYGRKSSATKAPVGLVPPGQFHGGAAWTFRGSTGSLCTIRHSAATR